MKIKVCGLNDLSNLESILALKPDFVGLNFYRGSKRFCSFALPPKLSFGETLRVGVFVAADIEEVLTTVKEYKLDFVQLHGAESREYASKLKVRLGSVGIIKVFSIGAAFDPVITEDFLDTADYFLYDSSTPMFGGSGEKFSWDKLDLTKNKSFFLAGGLAPQDSYMLRDLSDKNKNMFAVDINSHFETQAGVKNFELVNKFIKELRR